MRSLQRYSPNFPRKYNKNVLKRITELCQDADHVGISLMSNYFDRSLEITNEIHDNLDIPVIWGGIHPTLIPEDCIKYADMVCVGEGEYAMAELLQKRKDGKDYHDTNNLWFKHNGNIIKNPLRDLVNDLDTLPMQDVCYDEHYTINWEQDDIIKIDPVVMKSLIMDGLVLGEGKHFFQVMATRGCPHKCSYCCNYAIETLYPGQGKIRRRGVDNLIEELVYLKEMMPYLELVLFTDDSFLAANSKWLEHFRDEYKKKIGLPFFCQTNPVTITPKTMDTIIDAGLQIINLGMQTGSDRIKKMYNRNIPNEKVINAAKLLNQYKDKLYPPIWDVILDNPWETIKDKLETVKLMHSIPSPKIFQCFSLTFYPGTLIQKMAKEAGLIDDMVKDVYRKYYFAKDYTYSNFLYKLAEKDIPDWVFSILSFPVLVHVLNAVIPSKLFRRVVKAIQGKK